MTGDLVVTIAELGHLPMTTSIACDECPETFAGPGMWNAYARHLRTEHPQTEPTPPQREPEPPAKKEETVPPTADELTCPKCGRSDFVALKGRRSHEKWCKGSATDGGGPAVAPDPNPIESLEVLLARAKTTAGALNRYGWHIWPCPAHGSQGEDDSPASEADDPSKDCSCGFREALHHAGAA